MLHQSYKCRLIIYQLLQSTNSQQSPSRGPLERNNECLINLILAVQCACCKTGIGFSVMLTEFERDRLSTAIYWSKFKKTPERSRRIFGLFSCFARDSRVTSHKFLHEIIISSPSFFRKSRFNFGKWRVTERVKRLSIWRAKN